MKCSKHFEEKYLLGFGTHLHHSILGVSFDQVELNLYHLWTCNVIRNRLQHMPFPVKFPNFFENNYFEERDLENLIKLLRKSKQNQVNFWCTSKTAKKQGRSVAKIKIILFDS